MGRGAQSRGYWYYSQLLVIEWGWSDSQGVGETEVQEHSAAPEPSAVG